MLTLFILAVLVILYLAWISIGQFGPPQAEFKQGDKYFKVTNTTLNLAIILQHLMPERSLPQPDKLIEGDLEKGHYMLKELTAEEKKDWTEKDQMDSIKQALKNIEQSIAGTDRKLKDPNTLEINKPPSKAQN